MTTLWGRRPLCTALLLLVAVQLSVSISTPKPLVIIRNCTLYNPEYVGIMDIVIGGTKILAIFPTLSNSSHNLFSLSNVINANQSIVVPGIIDPHMHVGGGGGELGPFSRTPNAQFGQVVSAGITSAIGLRGTDSISRSAENVLQFLFSFQEMGLSTWMWTGSYHVPVDTVTSTIQRDIMLIDKIIGAGEIAISDHRSSWPSYQQLVELVSNCRVGGMLSGKAGIAYFHVGDGPTMLDPLWQIVNQTTIPITQMYPTHVSSRGANLINEGMKWVGAGGYVDFTADGPNETETTSALNLYRNRGVNLQRVTLSSDSYGSAPVYDASGTLIAYSVASPENLINQVRTLILEYGWSVSQAFALCTSNTASYLGLTGKGTVSVGNDADLLLLDSNLNVLYVIANGKILKTPTFTAQAMFPCM